MAKRGRKTADSIVSAAVLIGADRPRIEASEPLTPEQAIIFSDIVESLPGKFFEPAQSPLLCQMARHVISARRLSRWLDKIERLAGEGFDLKEYTAALDARRKETAQIVAIARALRLTNQSRYRPGAAGREADQGRLAGAKPIWEA